MPSQLKTPIFFPSCSTRRISPGDSSAAGQTGILVPAVSFKRWCSSRRQSRPSADRDLILLLRSDFSGAAGWAHRTCLSWTDIYGGRTQTRLGDLHGSDEFVPGLWSYLRPPPSRGDKM